MSESERECVNGRYKARERELIQRVRKDNFIVNNGKGRKACCIIFRSERKHSSRSLLSVVGCYRSEKGEDAPTVVRRAKYASSLNLTESSLADEVEEDEVEVVEVV